MRRGAAVDDTAPQRRPGEDRPERRGSVGTVAPRWGAASDLCTDAGGRGDPRPGASAGGCGGDPAPRPAAAEGLRAASRLSVRGPRRLDVPLPPLARGAPLPASRAAARLPGV